MISVIVPNYNSEVFLDDCIKSILCQSYRDFELLIVDDGSTDKSLEILRRWESKDDRINLIAQKNSGASSARNHGIDNAKGEWIVFVDSDDKVNSSYLEDLHKASRQDANIDLCIDGVSVYRDGELTGKREFPSMICGLFDANQLFGEIKLHKYGFSVGKLYRKSIIDSGNLRFDEQVCIAEDMMFMVGYILEAAHHHASKVAFIDKCNYMYNVHPGSLSTSSSPFENEYYSLNEYRNIIRLLVETFSIDKETNETLSAPLAYYTDRCINSIFQKVEQENRLEKLAMLNRNDYKKYKKCNTIYESFLKFLFVHKFWRLYSYLRK